MLSAGMQALWINQRGIILQTSAIPFDSRKLEALFQFIAKGLANFHWGVLISKEYFVGAGYLSTQGEQLFVGLMSLLPRKEVRGDLGSGMIRYRGVQATDDPKLTIWRFEIYNGVVVTGDPRAPGEAPSTIWASTSRIAMPDVWPDQTVPHSDSA